MLFLTYQFAGDQWLTSRLTLFARTTAGQRVAFVNSWQAYLPEEGLVVISDPSEDILASAESKRVVNLIRNPLAMLASFNRSVTNPTTLDSSSRDSLMSSISRMVQIAEYAGRCELLNVRIEDFAAFPVVKLQGICEFFGQKCSVDLVRSFLDADRPVRRKFRPLQIRGSASNRSSQQYSSEQKASDRARGDLEQLDLFSWVDHVPAGIAREVVQRHQSFFESYYPEVCRVCQSGELVRRVG